MHHESFFFQAFIYLLAAVVSVPVAKRLGLGSVLGYLLAGVLIGPFVLGWVGDDVEDVMHFAEFGVVMMLFLIGPELQPAVLWRMRGPILGLGGLQVGITAAIILVIVLAFGQTWQIALSLGLILALSSTAIVLQTLNEKGLMKSPGGQKIFSILLFQDIAVIPILAILPLLAMPVEHGAEIDKPAEMTAEATMEPAAHPNSDDHHHHGEKPHRPGWQQALMVLGAVLLIILAGRFLMRHIFRFIAGSGLREVFTAAALLIVIGIAVVMQNVGLSPALGTFLAGVVLANNEYRHELESNIEPFKGLLLGLFFISVGASIDFHLLAGAPGTIIGLTLMLIAAKMAVLFVLGSVFRAPLSERFMLTFSLAQGGEFAFVLFSFAAQNNVLPAAITSPLILAVTLSMLATPLMMIVNERLIQPRFMKGKVEQEPDEIDEHEHPVIIAGFGRFGQVVDRLLQSNGFHTVLLDLDPDHLAMVRQFGHKVFYGNASRLDLLEAAGAGHAKLLVVAIDDREQSLVMVETARKHFKNLRILARAWDRVHAYELMKRGVDVFHRETFDAALECGVGALRELGFGAHQAHRAARIFKKYDEDTLRKTFDLWEDRKSYVNASKKRVAELQRVLQDDHARDESESDHAWDTDELTRDLRDDKPLLAEDEV
ncbi:MAG: monovalent cation:proton antiporter-2 (CPA2) family protein [Verrucomicrobiota bacterium]